MRPLIAVIGRRSPQVGVLRFSGTIAAEAMCEAVWAGGGEPLVLHGPAADPGAGVAGRLQTFDGVLLPGGADLDPRRYGQAPLARTDPPVAHQDTFDLAVALAVLKTGHPTLAICRGMQVLNVALGGTLHQHLSPTLVDHQRSVHDVDVEPGSRLHAILGQQTVPVSSYHHQAVDRLADDLRVTGRAADGCIEAAEHVSVDILAVQWHPEDLFETSPTDLALFSDLAERARARRGVTA